MTNSPTVSYHQKYKYFPSLDIVRFVAFMLVFVSHASLFFGYINTSHRWSDFREVFLTHGDLGVTFFFVLSGFLITYLLMSEKHQNGEINIRKFYMRRLLRIWPVYFITIFIAVWALPYYMNLLGISQAVPFNISDGLNSYPWYVFFIGNFNMFINTPPSVTLAVLWSISVEQQFYLLWPLVIRKIKQRNIPLILLSVILVSTVYRFIHAYPYDYNTIKYSTFSVMSDIAIGCLVAWFFFEKSKITLWAKNLSHTKYFLIYYSSLIILILSRSSIFDVDQIVIRRLLIATEPVVFAVLFGFIIARLAGLRDEFITGRHPIQKMLVYLGQISYGLYCYHMIVLVTVMGVIYKGGYATTYHSIGQLIFVFFLTLIISIICAVVSYHFIEKNILKLKKRFQ